MLCNYLLVLLHKHSFIRFLEPKLLEGLDILKITRLIHIELTIN